MATQTKVELIDDLTGDKADETVLFGIDGREFEIDLSRDHAGELRDNLARYLAKARKVGKLTAASNTSKRTSGGQRQSREQTTAIREWARANEHNISDRGRIPLQVAKAFEDAHRGLAAVG
jgi:nucleoid-associated protein Lsr2